MKIQNAWVSLSPKTKRWIVIGGAVAALVLLFGVFIPDIKEKPKRRPSEGVIAHVLTDTDTRKVSIDALDATVRGLQDDKDRLQKEFATLKKERDADKKQREEAFDTAARELKTLRTEVEQWKRQSSAQPGAADSRPTGDAAVVPEGVKSKGDVPFEIRVISEDAASGLSSADASRASIRPPGARTASTEKSSEEFRVYLPPGSILTGTLLTGLDAPTGQAARRDPIPAVVRIQKDAILPNYFRADLRECFLLMSGYGDLSSERAYLRGEALSCIRADGKVIDTPLASAALGEDGKVGVRGRLVNKQGAVIARAMVAGFLEAFSSVFQRAAVPTLNLTSGDSTAFQKVLSSASLQTGAVAGVGKALDRLTQYYIDMAEQMLPVIEVDATREIDVVITTGTPLKLKH